MANGSQRRTLRRLLKEVWLIPPPPAPKQEKLVISGSKPFWRSLRTWLWAGFCAGASLIGYAAIVPRISIQTEFSLDPTNPFTESFSIQNEGLMYAGNVSVFCGGGAVIPERSIQVGKNVMSYRNFVKELGHGDRHTIPCDRLYGFSGNTYDFSTLSIEVYLLKLHR
jgi:hypothetical protein